MKVPTYSKYGLKKFEVKHSEERDRKVSKLLTHTLPLMLGGVLGVIVFFVYFYKSGTATTLQFFYQFFLFGTIGIICVGIPMVFFIFAERVYYYYLKKKDVKYQAVQQYKEDRDDYDFWKIRTDDAFWNNIDGLSIEKEVINLYMYMGYELLTEYETPDGERDHVLGKEGKKVYLDFRTDQKLDDMDYLNSLIQNSKNAGTDSLVLFSKMGYTKELSEYAKGKDIELLTVADIIKKVREIGRKK